MSQREIGKFVGTVQEFSPEQLEVLREFLATNSEAIAGRALHPQFNAACERLLYRYMELARRRNMTIQAPQGCAAVLHELTKELRLNCATFKLAPEKLVSATLLSGQPLRELQEDKILAPFIDRFRDLVGRAMSSYPADPHAYLHDVCSRFSLCEAHESQHEPRPLKDRTILFLAKTRRELEPLERLALFRSELQSLRAALEFEPLLALFRTDLARTRFLEGVLTRFKEEGCRPYLRNVLESFNEIVVDAAFEKLRSRRADILVGILRYGDGVKEFFKKMLEKESRITDLATRSGASFSSREIRVLCLRTPRKADKVEASLIPKLGQEELSPPQQSDFDRVTRPEQRRGA
jgi:hypothetical protein